MRPFHTQTECMTVCDAFPARCKSRLTQGMHVEGFITPNSAACTGSHCRRYMFMSLHASAAVLLSGLKTMELVARSPAPVTRADPSASPYRSVGTWIFLLLIFMLGTLFGLWLPRLCQRGQWMGGKIKAMAWGIWSKGSTWATIILCWAGETGHLRRSPIRGGTPKRGTHMNTGQMSPPWCNSTGTEASEGKVSSATTRSSPSSSDRISRAPTPDRGAQNLTRRQKSTREPSFRRAMEAMMAAASPRKP